MSVYLFASIVLLGVAVLLSLFLKQPSHPEHIVHHDYTPVQLTERHTKNELVLKPGTELVLTETN